MENPVSVFLIPLFQLYQAVCIVVHLLVVCFRNLIFFARVSLVTIAFSLLYGSLDSFKARALSHLLAIGLCLVPQRIQVVVEERVPRLREAGRSHPLPDRFLATHAKESRHLLTGGMSVGWDLVETSSRALITPNEGVDDGGLLSRLLGRLGGARACHGDGGDEYGYLRGCIRADQVF